MSAKSIFIFLLRILMLALVLSISSIIGSTVSGLAKLGATQNPEEAGNAFLILLGAHFISAILLSFFLARARWRGWRLIVATGGIYFGIVTFMTQLETLFFGKEMNIDLPLLSKIILSSLITTLLFSPVAVLIFRKMKGESRSAPFNLLAKSSLRWELPVLGVLYVVLYFVFGYFIAWQSSAVRVYYTGSTELLSFIEHMKGVFRNGWGLLLFQFFRGLLWAGMVLLILQSSIGKRWELIVLSGLLLGLLPSIQLFFPNPLMPYDVRMAHFVEIASSTFLFGMLAAMLLLGRSGQLEK